MNDIDPDYVVVGETKNYNWERLQIAINLVRRGAKLIGTNCDVVDKADTGYAPACGSLVAPIELATDSKAYYLGKPNPLIMRSGMLATCTTNSERSEYVLTYVSLCVALEKLGVTPSEAVIIGDRMDTDIIAGIESSIETVLVLSGVTSVATMFKFAYRPNYVFAGIGEILTA
jgi:NagD protein